MLLNETEDAPQAILRKELNAEPIDDVTFDHDLEDTPSKDNKDMARDDVVQPDGDE